MGVEIELLEQLKEATKAIQTVAEVLTIKTDGSINVNELNPLQEIMLKDGSGAVYKAKVNAEGRLLVDTNLIISPNIIITDPIDSNKRASVDDSGRLLVSTPPPKPPPNTTPVILTGFGSVSGDVDQEFLITNTKTLVIGRLLAGAAGMNKAGRITLYDNPDGNLVTMNIIATLYVNGSSGIADLSEKFIGDGIKKIILRRSNLGGGSAEMFSRFEGYEE